MNLSPLQRALLEEIARRGLPRTATASSDRPTLSLHDFTREAWHVLEPSQPFLDNWHIGVIAEHLEACSRGEIQRLVINMPPRHMKSLLVSVFWFAWTWTFQPSSRWLYASYAQTLSTRDSRKSRNLIQSPWYRERFGEVFTLTGDQNQKMRFENDRTGYRIATAVDALGTGEGGGFLICLPYDAMLTTDRGTFPIGRVVEDRMSVHVLSFDHTSNRVRWNAIEAHESSPGKPCVRIDLSDGRTVTATHEHPIYVQGRGYVAARELTIGDEVLTYGDNETMRSVRRSGNADTLAHGEREAHLLQSCVSRQVADGAKQSRIRRWVNRVRVRALRDTIQTQAVGRCALLLEAVFGRAHPVDGRMEAARNRDVCDVWCDTRSDSVQSGQAQLLQSRLREQGAPRTHQRPEQSALCAWGSRGGLPGRVPQDSAEDSRARRTSVQSVRPDEGRVGEGVGCSPHRLRQDEQCDGQSDYALSVVSRQTARRGGIEGRVSRALVVAVESAATPSVVFNVRVARDHNYFANGVLVHNCDDPHNVKQAESTLKRTGTLEWWFGTMSTRANDESTVCRVIVAQRVHDNDLSGAVISRDLGYEHLTIPARYEVGYEKLTSLQRERPELRDPRTVEGEPLHGARISDEQLTALEKDLGTYNAAGQLQQRPTPRTGGFFTAAGLPTRDAEGRPHVEPMGAGVERVRAWDIGGTDSKRGDFSAGVLLAKRDGRYAVCDIEVGQWAPNERNARIRATAQRDKERYGNVRTVVERGVGLAVEVTDNIVRGCAGYRIEVRSAIGDKESRADPLSDQCAGGNVYVVEAPWNAEFIDQCLRFPKVDHDDMVDAFSAAFSELAIERKVRIDL